MHLLGLVPCDRSPQNLPVHNLCNLGCGLLIEDPLLGSWPRSGPAPVTACTSGKRVQLLLKSMVCRTCRLGVLIEVNCETDFVARGPNFKELVQVGCSPAVMQALLHMQLETVPLPALRAQLPSASALHAGAGRNSLAAGLLPCPPRCAHTGKLQQLTCIPQSAKFKLTCTRGFRDASPDSHLEMPVSARRTWPCRQPQAPRPLWSLWMMYLRRRWRRRGGLRWRRRTSRASLKPSGVLGLPILAPGSWLGAVYIPGGEFLWYFRQARGHQCQLGLAREGCSVLLGHCRSCMASQRASGAAVPILCSLLTSGSSRPTCLSACSLLAGQTAACYAWQSRACCLHTQRATFPEWQTQGWGLLV